MDKDTCLLWVDVETTGFDPNADRLLEVGMVCTDAGLHPLDGGVDVVLRRHDEWDPLEDVPARMHAANGLWEECAGPDAVEIDEAKRRLQAYVRPHAASHRLLPAGSTVRFDRAWLDACMPGLLDDCSHRSLDVSVFLEAARLWNPLLEANMPEKTTNHRCLACLHDSIRYARHWRTILSRAEPIL